MFSGVAITIPFPKRDLHLRSVDQPFPTTTDPPPAKHLRLVEQENAEEEEY